ncbi:DUF3592 domain-containing protein [Streptomyces sp. NPDC058067]|uniref:DUF3592 domain-containing protein n=1 Tax=Streptomyces sp. NPDC058067 TaxID=3346324 RepID=UPI0036DFC1C4
MQVFFVIVPVFIAAVALFMAVTLTRRSMQVRRAWASGLTAEARCLRAYTTTSRDSDGHRSTTQHHVYEFTPGGGQPVRFEEAYGPATTVQGDVVTVHYTADRPDRATAHAPTPVRATLTLLLLLGLLGFVVAFCVFFVAVAARMPF